jgi:hypothetical protein
MANALKIEFPKKSNSRRRKIFERRARVLLEPFMRSAANEVGSKVGNNTSKAVDGVIAEIIDGISKSHEILSSGKIYKNEDEFFDILKKNVLK